MQPIPGGGLPDDGEAADRPLLRVVRGNPTPQELAALVTVLAARSAGAVGRSDPADRPSDWSAHWRRQGHLQPEPGAWRVSGWLG